MRGVVAIVLAAGTVLFWTMTAAGRYVLEITSETGKTLWTLPVSAESTVVLQYTNSLYNATTQEHFAISRGGFALKEVWSTSDAVLASQSLPTPYVRRGAYVVSSVHAYVPRIVTRIGPVGRQVLLVGDQELPLFEAGIGERLEITLRVGLLSSWRVKDSSR